MMPSRQPKRKDAVQTRAALIAAATESFARRGYQDTNVREICAKAGANLGAVRHYFGSKEQLYREVVVLAHHELVDRQPVPQMAKGGEPREALRDWVHYLLRIFLLRRAAHPFAGRLIAWELRDPTPVLDELIAEVLGPVRDSLNQIVADALGDADEPKLRARCANFIHGICVFHDQNRELLRRFGHPVPRTEAELVVLTDTIVQFAMAGIEHFRSQRSLPARRRSKTGKHSSR